MYLIDTDVISELRKTTNANRSVIQFFTQAERADQALYVSVVTIGELRRGVELLRHRTDMLQAKRLETWLNILLTRYEEHVLDFGRDEAQVWGRLRVPHPENAIDKQIAATALTHGLTLATRNTTHFLNLGVNLLNPFE